MLKKVTKTIYKIAGEKNLTARYGGEEFVVVLIKMGIDDARIIAEKIRENIADNKFEIMENKIVNQIIVTVSIGISELSENDSRIELIENADRKMYEAKEKGRNRVV